jgi:hypothetical protein
MTGGIAMRRVLFAVATLAVMGAAPAAFADCVNFSQARAARAAAALSSNPPTAAMLGMTTLSGLTLDAARTAGDPVCDGPPKEFYYTTNLTSLDFVTGLYQNIRRRTEADGMNRLWFKNPLSGDSFFLTSGTEITLQTRGDDGPITLITVKPADPVLPLTPESQPYTAAEIAKWTPWPGGPNGPRAFVRADGAGASAPPAQQTAQQSQTPAQPNCPAQGGSNTGSNAGAQIGGAVGGSYGRAAGAVLGGLMGSRRSTPQPQQNCR